MRRVNQWPSDCCAARIAGIGPDAATSRMAWRSVASPAGLFRRSRSVMNLIEGVSARRSQSASGVTMESSVGCVYEGGSGQPKSFRMPRPATLPVARRATRRPTFPFFTALASPISFAIAYNHPRVPTCSLPPVSVATVDSILDHACTLREVKGVPARVGREYNSDASLQPEADVAGCVHRNGRSQAADSEERQSCLPTCPTTR